MQDASDFPVETVAGFNMLPVILLIAAVALLGIGVFIGRVLARSQSSNLHAQSARDIHTAIAIWSDRAVKAPTGSLVAYAERLVGEIEARLGPARVIAGSSSAHLKNLKLAIDGGKPEAKAEKKDKVGMETTVFTPGYVASGEGGTQLLSPALLAQRTVAEAKADPMEANSIKAQLMRLKMVVEEFHTYWVGEADARIRELQAAQTALCLTGPLPPPLRDEHGGQRH